MTSIKAYCIGKGVNGRFTPTKIVETYNKTTGKSRFSAIGKCNGTRQNRFLSSAQANKWIDAGVPTSQKAYRKKRKASACVKRRAPIKRISCVKRKSPV